MAIKWYLAPDQTSWDQYWEDKSLQAMSDAVKKYDSVVKDVINRNIVPGTVFFEGGCGLGRWLVYATDQGCQRVIGLDSYAEPLKILKAFRPAIETIHGSVEDIPLQNESVDFYFSGGVIEHFEEGPGRCLDEAHRILKKNGLMLVTVPYLNYYRSSLRRYFVMPLLKLLKPRFRNRNRQFYQYYYSRRDMRRFLAEAQFTVVEAWVSDGFSTPRQSLGIYLEFPFLREQGGREWELNRAGWWLARLGNFFSRAIFGSVIGFLVKKSSATAA